MANFSTACIGRRRSSRKQLTRTHELGSALFQPTVATTAAVAAAAVRARKGRLWGNQRSFLR